MKCWTYIITFASSLNSSSDMHSSLIIFTATLLFLHFPAITKPNCPFPNVSSRISSSGSICHLSVQQIKVFTSTHYSQVTWQGKSQMLCSKIMILYGMLKRLQLCHYRLNTTRYQQKFEKMLKHETLRNIRDHQREPVVLRDRMS